MNELGEGDIDIINQPVVIDNVSHLASLPFWLLGFWINEGRHQRRLGAVSGLQHLVSSTGEHPQSLTLVYAALEGADPTTRRS